MRPMVFIPLFILFASCSRQKMSRFIPKDYEYPTDSIGGGKTFVYHDSLHNEDTYVALRSFLRGNDTVQSYTRYNAKRTLDSQIIKNDRLIETYYALSSLYPTLYKGEAIVEETTNDGTKLGTGKISYAYRNDTITATLVSESHFLKDTAVLWKGNLLPCLVIQSNRVSEVHSEKYARLNYTSKTLFVGYIAKNLGGIKFTLSVTDRTNTVHYSVWDLTAIEDGRKIVERGVN
jgi:hypothetical protein